MSAAHEPATQPDALGLFGPRLRKARLDRGLTLRAFAAELGVSPSAVSQMESGKTRPSMKRLHDIVRVLDIDLDEVFSAAAPATPPAPARQATQRPPLPPPPAAPPPDGTPGPAPDTGSIPYAAVTDQPRLRLEDGIEWFRISPVPLPGLEILRTVYPPGARAGATPEFVQHSGWEMGYMIEGRMRVQVAFTYRDIGPGESVCFDSSIPHHLSNPFTESATAIWIRATTPNWSQTANTAAQPTPVTIDQFPSAPAEPDWPITDHLQEGNGEP